MTNEKLGVLLVDVPEPKFWKYHYLEYSYGTYAIFKTDEKEAIVEDAFQCTEEEAKKYPQFRWVSLEEL